MQKLSGIISGKNNKSCGIIHHESNKIGFAFCCFSVIFTQFTRIRKTANTIEVLLLRGGP
jgi:hypothetical protein